MKIPDAMGASDKDWDKLKIFPAWQESKVKSKQEVIEEARREGKTVHFATFKDLWPSQKLQNWTRRSKH